MATSANDLVEEARSLLYSGQEPEANRLSGPIANGTVENFVLKYPPGSVIRGAVVSIGLEDIRIWDITGTSVTACERGVNGTTPAQHDDGTYVEVRAKFSKFRLLRAINQDIIDLSSPVNGLYRVKAFDVTYNPAISGYDFAGATDVNEVLELRWKQPGPTKNWPLITEYAISRNMAVSEFASGMSLTLYETAYPGLPIRVRYAADFGAMTSLTDDVVATTGLPLSALDIPPLGAAIRMAVPREIKRNFTEAQFDPHRLEEIPPGAELASSRGLQLLRQQRIAAEQARLAKDWPRFRR